MKHTWKLTNKAATEQVYYAVEMGDIGDPFQVKFQRIGGDVEAPSNSPETDADKEFSESIKRIEENFRAQLADSLDPVGHGIGDTPAPASLDFAVRRMAKDLGMAVDYEGPELKFPPPPTEDGAVD